MTTDPFDNLQYALRLSYELMKKDYEASPDSGDYVTGTNGAWEAVCEALAALDSIRDRQNTLLGLLDEAIGMLDCYPDDLAARVSKARMAAVKAIGGGG